MDKRAEHFIANRFLPDGSVVSVQALGKGLVNDTFLVMADSIALPRFVLQKINRVVFPYPHKITANLECLTRHLSGRADDHEQSGSTEKFRLPSLLSCTNGTNCYIEESGDYWRALTYIEDSQPLDRLESSEDAEQVGLALGRFHNQVLDLNADLMQDSLPGFHITPLYLSHYDEVVGSRTRSKRPGTSAELRFCEQFVAARRTIVPVLENARRDGRLRPRVIHGDPKLNNILFATQSRKALGMVDLDTVKSGLIHYDIGDCLRSCCNIAGESEEGAKAGFDLDICEAILAGYFKESRAFLTASDLDHLHDAIRLLPFELGLRFLSDYLEGNRYFKVEFPEHNLIRASVQFQVVKSVEKQEKAIRSLIRSISARRVDC
ncbi:MAG: phosphotransferase enzyme family protein [Methylococcales bacterium]